MYVGILDLSGAMFKNKEISTLGQGARILSDFLLQYCKDLACDCGVSKVPRSRACGETDLSSSALPVMHR